MKVRVLMRRVAEGVEAGGYAQAVGLGCRDSWRVHWVEREQLVRLEGSREWVPGGVERLVEGRVLWQESGVA